MPEIPIRQILSAAEAAQLVFIALVLTGWFLLALFNRGRHERPLWITWVVLLLFTIVLRNITTEASADRQSIFNIPGVPTISGITDVKALLIGDLLVVAILVAFSGG